MFGGEPSLERAHLGKWRVLTERWPAVARRVMRDPGTLERLEGLGYDAGSAMFELDPVAWNDLVRLLRERPRWVP